MKNNTLINAARCFCLVTILFIPLQASGYSEKDLQQFLDTHSCPGCDLSGAKLAAYDLVNANLEGANLQGVDLSGSILSMADLAGADFSKANLAGAVLEGADLYGANLEGVNFDGAKLDGAYLKNAAMDDSSVQNATKRTKKSIVTAASPHDASQLNQEEMDEAMKKKIPESIPKTMSGDEIAEKMSANQAVSAGTELDEEAIVLASAKTPDQPQNQAAALTETEAKVVQPNAQPKSPMVPVDPMPSGVSEEMSPPPIILSKEELREAFLDSKICIECDLSGVDLSGKNMKNALVERSNFEGANLKDANLREANLKATLLRKANLSGADLRDADLYKADLEGADLRGADLRGALLDGVYLEDALLEGARMDKDE